MIRAILTALVISWWFPVQAIALDDCNKLQQVGQLEQRPECLQKNNNELLAEIQKLIPAMQGVVRYNDHMTVQISQSDGSFCLSGDRTGAGFLRQCEMNGVGAATYSIRKLP